MKRRNSIFLGMIFLFFTEAKAQLVNEFLNFDYRVQSEKYLGTLSNQSHSAVKPLLFSDVNFLDSTEKQKLSLHYSNFNSSSGFKWSAFPITGTSYSQNFSADSSFVSMGIGAGLQMNYKNKWIASIDYYSENASFPNYVGSGIQFNEVIPSLGTAQKTGLGYAYSRVSGFVAYHPSHFFELKAGVGKNFIGDGYRSILLSDNASQYPYFRINTTFWRLRYTNLYCVLDDIRTQTNFAPNPIRKFTTIHFLDWNISKRVNLGIFESVVWQSKDTLYNRGFEVQYLNPVIFYRTVEYSLGSSDNSILGLNGKLKINDHYQLYAQFVLDEFLLSEVLAGNGWWGNKYGVQFGVKAIEPFTIKNLFVQSEFNVVRPFTFSHGSAIQNYGHHNQPLAHPIGANFWESVSIIRYQWKNVVVSNQTNIALYGTDSIAAVSYGGDIYQSNRIRIQERYNRIGQGISNDVLYNRFSVAWVIDPAYNLRIELAHVYRKLTNQYFSNEEHFITFSLKTNLWNSYTDY